MYSPDGLALHVARGAGEEAQVVHHERDLVLEERAARLARVGRLEVGELVGVLLDRVGQLEQRLRALAGRGGGPALERAAGGLTARFTSSSPDSGASAIASPVAGLSTSSVAPSAGSTNSPSMKFCKSGLLCCCHGCSCQLAWVSDSYLVSGV